MTLGSVVTVLLNGLGYGIAIALIAVGLTLIFGIMNIVNFAHGEFYMLGAFGILFLTAEFGSYLLAVILTIFIVAVFGVIIERLTLAPLYNRDPLLTLIVTFGLVLVFQQLALTLWGGNVRRLRATITGTVDLGITTYPLWRFLVIFGAGIILLAVIVFIRQTRWGLLMRATAEDMTTARTLGVRVNRVYMFTFFIGTGLAVIAAAFLAPIRTVNPTMSTSIILDSFIVVILGGLGSVIGAIVAALSIGLIEAFFVGVIPGWANQVVKFSLMIVILLVKPEGLFGTTGGG